MDKANLHELIKFIQESIALIKRRFEGIQTSDDFLANDEGIDRLDAISMRLQGIGEAIKNIDKRERDLLLKVADGLYWSKIIKTREILTHHYIDIDSQIIYEICHDKLAELEGKIQALQNILE